MARQNLLEHVNSYCVMWMSHGVRGMTARPCFMLTAKELTAPPTVSSVVFS